MGQTFSVRRMRQDDIPAAAAIEAAVPDGWSARAISEYAAMDASRCFVAASGQGVCGFAAFTCVAGEANLDALSVAAHTRRCGAAAPCWAPPSAPCVKKARRAYFWRCAHRTRPRALCILRLGLHKPASEKGFTKTRRTMRF